MVEIDGEQKEIGGWGGTCRCPNGEEYQVGDIKGSRCGKLACVNGEKVSCNKEEGEWSRKKVKCALI